MSYMHYYCLPLFTERNSSNLEIVYCLGLSDLNTFRNGTFLYKCTGTFKIMTK